MVINKSQIDLEAEIPQGAILVKTLCLSVDPYLRGRKRDESIQSYIPAFSLNQPMSGFIVGEVLKSNNVKFTVGDYVYGTGAIAEYTVVPEAYLGELEVRNEIKTSGLPITNYIGVLGLPSWTAYVGLIKFGKPKKGETLYVSAASGAVGQLVGQLGKALGMYVVGSVGSDDKIEYLKEIGFDAAFNYKTHTDFTAALKEHCPNGIDVYYENVGGKMLDVFIINANYFARIIACGMISQYNLSKPKPLYNIVDIIAKGIKIEDFIIMDHKDMEEKFLQEVTELLVEKKIQYKEDVANGIETTPQALIDVLRGKNFGKQAIKVAL